MPAALAAAEEAGASGARTIAAIVAGYEIQIRLSMALGPSDHYERGFHPTATCGAFGAAAAVGNVLGLDAAQIESAFGICLSQAAGSMQFLADGAWTKRSHVGHAAMCGLMAATLAAEGFRGPAQAFEGKAGFLASHAPDPDPAKAVAGPRRGLGDHADRGEALSVLPLRPRGDGRHHRPAREARPPARGCAGDRGRPAGDRLEDRRRPARRQAETRKASSTASSPCPSSPRPP